MTTPQQLVSIVEAIQSHDVRGFSFFNAHDLWRFHYIADNRLCNYCRAHKDGALYRGDALFHMFPDLLISDLDELEAQVHPKCRCTLTRE